MPFKVVCHQCTKILYESANSPKAPYEIISKYSGKCPRCAKKLSRTPLNLEVRPVN